jgi:hypothetical protein
VVLCHNLNQFDEKDQVYAVAHEIAHAKLDHRKTPRQDVYERHEKEANELVKTWIGYGKPSTFKKSNSATSLAS